MICWKCGYQNPEDNKFCSSCGASLQIRGEDHVQDTSQESEIMVCWKCGHLNSEDNQFCSSCGANLRHVDQVSEESSEIKPQPTREAKQPQPAQRVNPQPVYKSSSEQHAQAEGGLLRVIGVIFAVIYLIKILITIPDIFINIGDISWGRNILVSIGDLFITILMIFSFAVFAFILFLFAMRRTKENEEMMYLSVVSAAVLRLAAATIDMIWNFLFQSVLRIKSLISGNVFLTWFWAFLFIAFVVGLLFVLFLIVGKRPLLGKSLDELKQMLKDLPDFLQKEAEQFSSGFVAGRGKQKQQKNSSGVTVPNQMKTNRSLFIFIILTILTCGIYEFCFLHEMAKDINKICEEDGESTTGVLKLIIFTILTCGIYWYIWEYQFQDRLASNAPRYGVTMTETGSTVLLWTIFGLLCCGIGPFVAFYIMIKNLNRMSRAYNEKISAQAAENIE